MMLQRAPHPVIVLYRRRALRRPALVMDLLFSQYKVQDGREPRRCTSKGMRKQGKATLICLFS